MMSYIYLCSKKILVLILFKESMLATKVMSLIDIYLCSIKENYIKLVAVKNVQMMQK